MTSPCYIFLLETLKPFYEGRLVTRIQELIRICEEEGEPKLSVDSLALFVHFIIEVGFREYPDIVLTPEGNIRIKESTGFREFLPTGKIKQLYKKHILTTNFQFVK